MNVKLVFLLAARNGKKERTNKQNGQEKSEGKKGRRRNIQHFYPMGSQSLILWPVQQPLPSSSLGRFLFYLFVQAPSCFLVQPQGTGRRPAMHTKYFGDHGRVFFIVSCVVEAMDLACPQHDQPPPPTHTLLCSLSIQTETPHSSPLPTKPTHTWQAGVGPARVHSAQRSTGERLGGRVGRGWCCVVGLTGMDQGKGATSRSSAVRLALGSRHAHPASALQTYTAQEGASTPRDAPPACHAGGWHDGLLPAALA